MTAVVDSGQKRLLFIAHAFPPLAASGSFRSARFARYLTDYGWQPTVLTIRQNAISSGHAIDASLVQLLPADIAVVRTTVFRPIERLSQAIGPWLCRDHRDSVGCRSTSIPDACHDRTNGSFRWTVSTVMRRLANNLRSLCAIPDREIGWLLPALSRGWKLLHEHEYAAICSTGPPHSAHIIAVCLGVLTSTPVLLDLRDPWARKPWNSGRSPVCDRIMEHWCVRRAACVVLNTEQACDEFRAHYSHQSPNKFAWIPNGVDPEFATLYSLQVTGATASIGCRANSPIRFCHPGEVYGKRSLIPLIRALAALKRRGVVAHLEQIGDIADTAAVTAEIEGLGLHDEVTLRGRQSHAEALGAMGRADCLVVLQPQTATQIPAKLFEMLHFEHPILLLGSRGATSEIVERFRLGTVEDSDNPDQIANAMHRTMLLVGDSSQSGDWRKARDEFDGRELTGKLADLLNHVGRSSREHHCVA